MRLWALVWLGTAVIGCAWAQDPVDAAEDAKQKALAEGAKLREEARTRAQERIRNLQAGKVHVEKEIQEAKKVQAERGAESKGAEDHVPRRVNPHAAPPPGLDAEGVREWRRQQKHLERLRILREHKEEMHRAAQMDDPRGRILKAQLENVPPTCQDGVKGDHETDVDCGGDACRDETRLVAGVHYPRTCAFAQSCHVDRDCSSRRCVNRSCAAREPFSVVSQDDLERTLHNAFMTLAGDNSPKNDSSDLHIKGSQVDRFYSLVFNPDNQRLAPSVEEKFVKLLNAFKQREGLFHLGQGGKLRYGFLSRGASLEFCRTVLNSFKSNRARAEL